MVVYGNEMKCRCLMSFAPRAVLKRRGCCVDVVSDVSLRPSLVTCRPESRRPARAGSCHYKRRLTRRVWSFPLATTSVEAQGAAVLYLNHPDPKNRSRIQEVNRLC